MVLSTHTGGLGTPARLDGAAYGLAALKHYRELGVEFACIYPGYLGGEEQVALAEKACWMSVADALDEGCGSVGTKLELEHTAPTPVGMTVTCESELTAVEGRKLVFKVSLYDEKGPVGGGVHERFVVNDAKFAAKAESKKG